MFAALAGGGGGGTVFSTLDMPDGTERPVVMASRSLSPVEENYSQIDREALSMSMENTLLFILTTNYYWDCLGRPNLYLKEPPLESQDGLLCSKHIYTP